ncbi:YafY family transcriptional regulator [Phytoactinopolyspora alkaliphila]|uniref:YafY family transcriptional regulator n=1 Tax=Phytoactinopolyspora alkaliphila TaxID=1783498 RepID=A0A6N9YI65_9ACTN|nr:YafY family protein [Phytoactinopolyspora alkaliphila]NED94654.1 YafY family transcriptional regulator [Phytoactinopolyspora alkaliphila]
MLETSARLLRLLSLLQARREWTGAELAGRLDVSTRTIRNDIDKLRSLGYPVNASPGVSGGYQLGAGADLPPLLLDDDEAVAVAVGLRTAATGTVAGIEETSVRALAKLEQVLPSRLRRRVNAMHTQTVSIPYDTPAPTVDSDVLATLSLACRDHERTRFGYRSHNGTETSRAAEPYRLVRWGRRWYLVAWDLDRQDWRTFRVDRIATCTPVGARFSPRELPDEDIAAYVARQVSVAPRRFHATFLLHTPLEAMQERLNAAVGTLEHVDEHTCRLRTANDSLEQLALTIGLAGVDFEVVEPPELVAHIQALADRYRRAVPAST